MNDTKKKGLDILEYITSVKAEDIDLARPLGYYGCDSLDVLDVEVRCEKAFGITIKEALCSVEDTVMTLINRVHELRTVQP